MPANNLVFYQTGALLGEPVEARFGQDFPIRFDFLDTMQGGNLSLQVHPTTQYIRDTFGIYYTQDESYYLLDATEGATVYLGLKSGTDPGEMIAGLQKARQEGINFDVEQYINKWPAKKHDHFLIPGGTIHCSGQSTMVLEISSTPGIFTFKLWDWGRMGLDGKPRPINIEHGSRVLQWDRDTEYTRTRLINRIETGGGVNVLNVIEGDELIVESPTDAFEPFTVHYAETFIIPAAVGNYTIRPADPTKKCGTIKAYVRFRE
jgi:mannose-6-phosphate isomerase class I